MIFDIIGTVGVALVVYAYFLIQMGKVTIENIRYSIYNMVGSLLIIVSLTQNFNFPSMLIESFWVLISILGLFRVLKNRRLN